MAAEQPGIAAVIARLDNPKIHLAAYGGVVFPIVLVVEAPIIMLLAASTELSRDRGSYRALQRFTHLSGGALTAVHFLVVATPLYGVLVEGLLGVPPGVAEQARSGLLITLPWSWAIAWRRTGQGVLIRFGRSSAVTRGTIVRLFTGVSVLVLGLIVGTVPGVVVGATALTLGVLTEGIYVAAAVRPVVRRRLDHDDPAVQRLEGAAFWRFYLPLAMMPIVTLMIQPIGTSAISRMPEVVDSLAVWPVVNSLVFVLQAAGIAYNEVVVALIERPQARVALWRFSVIAAAIAGLVLAAVSLTPLRLLWFGTVAGLDPHLTALASDVVWMAIPIPLCRFVQSWYQGLLVASRRTIVVTEAVVVFALVCSTILIVGVMTQSRPGLEVTLFGFAAGRVAQTLWLALRSRGSAVPISS